MNLYITTLLLIASSCLADNYDRSDRSKIADSLDNSVSETTNGRNKSKFSFTSLYSENVNYKQSLKVCSSLCKNQYTLES